MRAILWERPAFQGQGKPVQYELVCCAEQPLDLSRGSPADRDGWCPCSSLPETVDIEVDSAPWASDWGRWIQRPWSTEALDPALSEMLGKMTMAYWVVVSAHDDDHHEALQSAWAAVRWLVELGAFAVFDAPAMRWLAARQVVAWGDHRPFSLHREVHQETWLSDAFEVVTSHGMAKFGRPDVLLHLPRPLPEAEANNLRQLLGAVLHRLAAGELLQPGDFVTNGFARGQLLGYRPDVLGLPVDVAPDTLVLVSAEVDS